MNGLPFFARLSHDDPKLALFAFNLLYDNIQTPHNNFITHASSFPNIYPTDTCPLCRSPRADAFHMLCECPCIARQRHWALTQSAQKIRETLKLSGVANKVVYEWTQSACIPADRNGSRAGFNRGLITGPQLISLSRATHDLFNPERNGSFALQSIVYSHLLNPIVKAYTESLLRTRNSFSHRLRTSYNISISEKHSIAKN